MDQFVLTVLPEDAGMRLDQYVTKQVPELTRNAVQRLCEQGHVLVQGVAANKKYCLRDGDVVQVTIPPLRDLEVCAQPIPLDIVYEDNDLLVVNKPRGMVVHPAPGNEDGTLVNALLYHCGDGLPGIGGSKRPGIVHRIDKDTSGLLVVAKTDMAHSSLSEQIAAHSVTRQYRAVVYGNIGQDDGWIDAPIGRHPIDRKKMCVTQQHSRSARTHYQVVERLGMFTHLALTLETGRTHQIRVHMASIGHPVAGDPVYGPKKTITSLCGQCLHAHTIGFMHPRSGQYLSFTADLPAYFIQFLKKNGGQII